MNNEVNNKRDAGMSYKIKECDTKEVTFYHINAIGIYTDKEDNNREYGCIHTNGTEWITPLRVSELEDTVEEHLKKDVFFLKS